MRARLSNLQQQLREKDDQLLEKANLLKERDRLNGNLRAINQQLKNARGQLQDQELLKTNMQEQLEGKEQQLVEMELRLREMNQQLRDLQVQITEKDRATVALQERLGISVQQVGELEEQLTRKDQEKNELAKSLSTAQKTLRDNQVQRSPDWVIARNQIQLTGKTLGRGAWGEVAQGRFCGCVVAVKTIYDVILSPHNLRLFMREMDIASRCRHPCLLQFIGATNDDHTPLFLTELMETSLQALLEERSLSQTEITVIALDVARGLNYLHQKRPIPILHRDISSANVLLWRQGTQWRAKVSDYGTANFKKQTMTVAPGAPIYSAPEAHATNQTVKVDVYSFGVLLCEMSIRELPDPEIREQQVAMVTNSVLRALIRRCLETDPQARPSMEELIDEIELETQGTV
nr:probable serine/threonine-protein kinase drkD isoform X2 [Pocillopora verrucosa]